MPGFDKTGPMGQGPMTGRRRGYCYNPQPPEKTDSETNTTNEKNIIWGVGRGGRPRGGGMGFCNGGRRRRRF